MLVIRLQRTGRKGHAQFRVVVQDSRRTPTSGKIVAAVGSFNPHSKEVVLDKEKITKYLQNGAQPSDRVARLLKNEGVKLPTWVKLSADKSRAMRHPEKLRKNQPEKPAEEVSEPIVADEVVETPVTEETVEVTETKEAEPATDEAETPVESSDEVAVEESPTEPVSE